MLPVLTRRLGPAARTSWMQAGLLATLLVATACGGNAEGNNTEPVDDARQAETPDTEDAEGIDALIEAAQAEGGLHIYTSVDPDTAERVSDVFGAKYGIDVEFTRQVSGPLTARYAAEAEANVFNADVLIASDDQFVVNAVEQGWMIPMTTTAVPAVEDVPEEFRREASAILGVTVFSNILVNTDRVSGADVPQTWTDLLEPRWQGQIFAGDPRAVTVVLAAWQALAEEFGDDFVTQMRDQELSFMDSMVAGSQLVAAGERDGAIGVAESHVTPVLAEAPEAPVELHALGGLSFGFEWHAGVSARSANPNAGRLFVHWLLTEEGQEEFLRNVGPSVFPDIEIAGFPPLGEDYVALDIATANEERDRILSLLGLTQ